MRDELQDKLNKDFPTLFTKSDWKKGIYGTRHCECSDGWYNVIQKACEKLAKLNIPELKFYQVKEKFGSLRLYTNFYSEIIGAIVSQAEQESISICEQCGSTSSTVTSGSLVRHWVRSLCPACHKKADEEYEKRKDK